MARRIGLRMRAFTSYLLMVTLVATPLLAGLGCGGSAPPNGNGGGDGIDTGAASGTVDTSEIGGDTLRVYSALAGPATVDASGGFSTTVSEESAQLLIAMDDSNDLRGLCVTAPPPVAGASTRATITFDADATATALLFTVPGILALDPEEAAARIAELQGYESFTRFADYLRQHLPDESLNSLVAAGGGYEGLFEACVTEWLAAHPVVSESAGARADNELSVILPAQGDRAGFDVTIQDSSSYPNMSMLLENNGWRWVEVRRRDESTPATGGEVTWSWAVIDPSMAGVNGFTWGSMFTGTPFDGGTKEDALNFSGLEAAEYWVKGPGFKASNVPAVAEGPPGAQPFGGDAWGKSVVLYIAMPFICLLGGIGEASKLLGSRIIQLTNDTWNVIAGAESVAEAKLALITLITSGGDVRAIVRGLLDLVNAVLLAMASMTVLEPVLAAIVGAGAAAELAPLIATGLTIASATMGAANLGCAVAAWSGYPVATYFQVVPTPYGIILKADPNMLTVAPGATTVIATAKEWASGQDPNAGHPPEGIPMEGVALTVTTTLGHFAESGAATLTATTGVDGEVSGTLLSDTAGSAVIRATNDKGNVNAVTVAHWGHGYDTYAVSFDNMWPPLAEQPGPYGDKPCKLAMDSDDNLYLVDPDNGKVMKYATAGGAPDLVTEFGTAIGPPLLGPYDIAVDEVAGEPDSYVWVADTGNSLVQKFTTAGTWELEKTREIPYPIALDVDDIGTVYVLSYLWGLDHETYRMYRFSDREQGLDTYWEFYNGVDPNCVMVPQGMAVDAAGNVYVADTGNKRVVRFTPLGEYISNWSYTWTCGAETPGEMLAGDIEVDPDGNSFVIGSSRDRSVFRFGLTGTFLSYSEYPLSYGEHPGHLSQGVTVNSLGDVFVYDWTNKTLVKMARGGAYTPCD